MQTYLSANGAEPPRAEMWDVTDGITAATDDFQFTEAYMGTEVIAEAGTVIATDGGTSIVTPYDNCMLMMPSYKPGAGTPKLRLCRRVG